MAFQNIIDANGFGIAITGMVIVFVVLVLISGFIAGLPRVLAWVETFWPETDHHGEAAASKPAPATPSSGAPEEIIAAIGVAFHARRK